MPQRIARSFFVAAWVSAVLYSLFTFSSDKSGFQGLSYLLVLLLIGMAFSLLSIVVLALPAFLLLVRLKRVNLWSALGSRFLIGAITAAVTEWPQSGLSAFTQLGWNDHAVRRLCVHAAIGVVSALCFWRVWRPPEVKR